MTLFSELRLRLGYILWPTIWAALFLYITFHILQGERGLIAYCQKNAEVLSAITTWQNLNKKRLILQNRVKLLSPPSVDYDMLDERVRVMLGYSKSNETLILLKE